MRLLLVILGIFIAFLALGFELRTDKGGLNFPRNITFWGWLHLLILITCAIIAFVLDRSASKGAKEIELENVKLRSNVAVMKDQVQTMDRRMGAVLSSLNGHQVPMHQDNMGGSAGQSKVNIFRGDAVLIRFHQISSYVDVAIDASGSSHPFRMEWRNINPRTDVIRISLDDYFLWDHSAFLDWTKKTYPDETHSVIPLNLSIGRDTPDSIVFSTDYIPVDHPKVAGEVEPTNLECGINMLKSALEGWKELHSDPRISLPYRIYRGQEYPEEFVSSIHTTDEGREMITIEGYAR